jgi:hypothetical protein
LPDETNTTPPHGYLTKTAISPNTIVPDKFAELRIDQAFATFI